MAGQSVDDSANVDMKKVEKIDELDELVEGDLNDVKNKVIIQRVDLDKLVDVTVDLMGIMEEVRLGNQKAAGEAGVQRIRAAGGADPGGALRQ